MNKIQEIIEQIKQLEKELLLEIQKKEEDFFYRVQGKKVYFEKETKKYHKKLAVKISSYLSSASLFNILTVPFIWSCLAPALLMDITASLYQCICFRIYSIPRVNRRDYIVLDRQNLDYLNFIEKLNCFYCGYFNGLIAYLQEIAARTEQYWCPIKHARKLGTIHNRYHKFMEYGDSQQYHLRLEQIRRDFNDLRED
ncbi:hypothetical protein [Desulfogranum mediterraneum]|uniref:hypothetical protein n=1 Tax=Desulfogranum mediterraneum TaxID=160661 RepID=UPI000401C3D2|nr:hypothetical protein [Desulfogranum mediterraneum]